MRQATIWTGFVGFVGLLLSAAAINKQTPTAENQTNTTQFVADVFAGFDNVFSLGFLVIAAAVIVGWISLRETGGGGF